THLQIKTSIAPLLLANEAVSRQKKLLVVHREGMHAPVARGSISLGAEGPAVGLLDEEVVPVKTLFFEEKERQATGTPAAIRIGTRQQPDEISASCKRTPGFGAIDQIATLAPDLSRFSAPGEGGHIRARIRLSYGHRN